MTFIILSVLPFLMVPILIALLDYIALIRARLGSKHVHDHTTIEHTDFSVLVPIFGDLSYLKNVEFLSQYGEKVILCTTLKETAAFNQEIDAIAQQHRFRVHRSHVPVSSRLSKPNPWRLFSNTLQASDAMSEKQAAWEQLLHDGLEVVQTEYCIFIDGDTVAKEPFTKLIGLMRERDFDLASVRVLASKQETVMERLQSYEYELAMDGRRLYPWLTSGAGVVIRTRVIRDIMSHHSLFFSGGDIEIGKLAGLLKYKTGHLFFEFYTDVPATFRAWFKQRLVWSGGGFRHAIVNFYSYSWRHPIFFLYFTVLVYGATPLRWYELLVHPTALPMVIAIYWVLTYILLWRRRSWYLLLIPFYSLIQIMIILPLGIYMYFRMALHSENVGLIRLRERGT